MFVPHTFFFFVLLWLLANWLVGRWNDHNLASPTQRVVSNTGRPALDRLLDSSRQRNLG